MELKKYALFVLLAGGATLLSFMLITIMSGGGIVHPIEYPNNQRFDQAITWFEMLQSPDEVKQVLGEPATGEGVHMRQVMDTINTYDFIFMICYPLLFAALIVFLNRMLANKGYQILYSRILVVVGLFLSVVMLLGDASENIQLFKISAYNNLSDIKPEVITTLQVATRIKSVPIFLSSLILAYLYILYFRKSWGIIMPAIYGLSALLGFIAMTASSVRFLIEPAFSILAFGWVVSIVHGGLWYARSRKMVEG